MQNIFDNEQFFSGYQELRRKEQNSNDLIIDPALDTLLPDMTEKTVLDLGCGDGKHCVDFLDRGAKKRCRDRHVRKNAADRPD